MTFKEKLKNCAVQKIFYITLGVRTSYVIVPLNISVLVDEYIYVFPHFFLNKNFLIGT